MPRRKARKSGCTNHFINMIGRRMDGAHHDGAEAGSQTQILVFPRGAGVYAVVLVLTKIPVRMETMSS
jgi:hypothetical protein